MIHCILAVLFIHRTDRCAPARSAALSSAVLTLLATSSGKHPHTQLQTSETKRKIGRKTIVWDFFFKKENKSAVESNISGSLDLLSHVRKEQETSLHLSAFGRRSNYYVRLPTHTTNIPGST